MELSSIFTPNFTPIFTPNFTPTFTPTFTSLTSLQINSHPFRGGLGRDSFSDFLPQASALSSAERGGGQERLFCNKCFPIIIQNE